MSLMLTITTLLFLLLPSLFGLSSSSNVLPGSAFDYLDAPVTRVTGADVPTAYAQNLEDLCFPETDNVIKAVKKTLNFKL